MAQYRSPAPLNFIEPKWELWISTFKTFRLVTKLHNEPEEIQIASLKYCMGPEADDVMKTFGLSLAEETKYEIVLQKFQEYFKPKVNIIRLRRIFQRRMQEGDESEEVYLRALFVASNDCEFGELKKERIRDQFIAGIHDETLAEKLEHLYLSKRNDFTLDLIIEYTRTYCNVREGRKNEKIKEECISYVGKSRSKHSEVSSRSKDHRQRSKNNDVKIKDCSYCGDSHKFRECPAFGKMCTSCKTINHFAKVCRSRNGGFQSSKVHEVVAEEEDSEENDYAFLGECLIDNVGNPNNSFWSVKAKLNDCGVIFKIDTGAAVNLINYETYSKLVPLPPLLAPRKKLITPSSVLEIEGCFDAYVSYKGKSMYDCLYVLPKGNKTNNLMSKLMAEKLSIVEFIGSIETPEKLFGFGEWRTDPVEFSLKKNIKPFSIATPRNIPVPLLEPVKKALDKMISEDIIEPVTEATQWNSAMVPVLKD